jgi:Anaphase-promoting complex, cyclosome, subunit 4/Anaphase-promoting complex subunit 4 WD40 domain
MNQLESREDGDNDAEYKAFTPIHTKRFWSLVNTCSLCPSMDLVVFGMLQKKTTTDSVLWIHRTVSWQRLATLAGMSCTAWRPDGRLLAVAHRHGIVLYHLEDLLSSSSSAMRTALSPEQEESLEAAGGAGVVGLLNLDSSVSGLCWSHVSTPHPSWQLSCQEMVAQSSWMHRRQFLDRGIHFFPPSGYFRHAAALENEDETADSHDSVGTTHVLEPDDAASANEPTSVHSLQQQTVFPTSRLPLSVLCVSTVEHGILVYLHGRYPAVRLSKPASSNPVSMVVSPDLSHILVHEQHSSSLTLYSIPALARHRYHLQSIATAYITTTAHLQALQRNRVEVLAAWRSSLKPLDLKLAALSKLLVDYGLSDDLRSNLCHYLLSGQSSSSQISSAMDQFCTGVQMNDQLLMRMERSLQVAMAHVETLVRRNMVSPALALVWEAQELQSLALYAPYLFSLHSLGQNAQDLLVAAEAALLELVDARSRLKDFVAWLQGTAARIKARGTARTSVQQDQARKRRVPQAVVERVLQYFQPSKVEKSGPASASLTERVLNISFSKILDETSNLMPLESSRRMPLSDVGGNSGSPTNQVAYKKKATVSATPSIPFHLEQISQSLEQVFSGPREFLAQSVEQRHIRLAVPPQTKGIGSTDARSVGGQPIGGKDLLSPVVAMTVRMGCDRESQPGLDDDTPADGFFAPNISQQHRGTRGENDVDLNAARYHRQWAVFAHAQDSNGSLGGAANCVQLSALPLSWTFGEMANHVNPIGEAVPSSTASFYLRATLVFPPGSVVVDMAFYGDDGKSSLGAGFDGGTGKEGRQALGVLLKRTRNASVSAAANKTSLELWLIQYDAISFQVVKLEEPEIGSTSLTLSVHPATAAASVTVVKAGNNVPDNEALEDSSASDHARLQCTARVRTISTVDSKPDHTGAAFKGARLVVSGSRGIGAVLFSDASQSGSVMELLDLEDDEYVEEEEEEEGDD